MSMLVQLVVGELELLERHHLLGQVVAAERRVGMGAEAVGHGRVGLAGHQPRRAVVGVAVALAVHRHHVHQHVVLGVRLAAAELGADGGEHAPTVDMQISVSIRDKLGVLKAIHSFK